MGLFLLDELTFVRAENFQGATMRADLFVIRAIAAMAATPMASMYYPSQAAHKPKLCVNCKNPKHHNNAYCSAECCKAHKSKANVGSR